MLAKFLSILFHPVFLPIYFLGMVYFVESDPFFLSYLPLKTFVALSLLLVFYAVVFPLFLTKFMHRFKQITDYKEPNKTDRFKLLLIMFGIYALLWYFFRNKGLVLKPLSSFMLCNALCVFGLFILNFFHRVSLHVAAMATLSSVSAGYFVAGRDQTMLVISLVLILVTGIMGSMRLKLNAHTLSEVLSGWVWGLVIGFVSVLYL